MKKQTIQTIVRHLKGITAAIEKELTKECPNCGSHIPIPGNWNKGTWEQKCTSCGKMNRIVIE